MNGRSPEEVAAIEAVVQHGRRWGYGNMIDALERAWGVYLKDGGVGDGSPHRWSRGPKVPPPCGVVTRLNQLARAEMLSDGIRDTCRDASDLIMEQAAQIAIDGGLYDKEKCL
jgi:hypothetical protein